MSEEVPEGEEYWDVVKQTWRRRRGKRQKRGHGPMSGYEKRMSRSFQWMTKDMHWMDGDMADAVAIRFNAQFAATRIVLQKYSYDNVPDPGPEDIAALKRELDIAEDDAWNGGPDDDGNEFNLGDLK